MRRPAIADVENGIANGFALNRGAVVELVRNKGENQLPCGSIVVVIEASYESKLFCELREQEDRRSVISDRRKGLFR